MNEKKAKALELLLRGDTVVSIANELEVGRRTIYNWLQSDAEFRKAKQKNENIILDNLYIAALSEMENLLYEGSNYEKIAAATQILKLKKGSDVITIEKPKTVDELLLMTKNY